MEDENKAREAAYQTDQKDAANAFQGILFGVICSLPWWIALLAAVRGWFQ